MAILAPAAIAAAKSIGRATRRHARSAPQAKPSDQGGVALGVRALQIVEQPPAQADHDQEAAPRVKILLMGAEMVGQIADALRQDRHLHLGRSGIALFGGVFADERLLALGSK